uniref:Uncharacterized protein n=1 Tax=Arsenophonus endosymbiont of Trialeurodes vaporariorum TaxID=235567 RepID=A0A3B0MQK8_9GAMM
MIQESWIEEAPSGFLIMMELMEEFKLSPTIDRLSVRSLSWLDRPLMEGVKLSKSSVKARIHEHWMEPGELTECSVSGQQWKELLM